ncbi:MAG: hypothetical protein V4585_17675 [Bacteroidota bacterium]
MKAENKKMAANLVDTLLPKFKGLGEKSATKIIKNIEKIAEDLAKKFHRLLEEDSDNSSKMEKKASKKLEKEALKQKKALHKAAMQEKIAMITISPKPRTETLKPSTQNTHHKATANATKAVKEVE